MKERPILFSAPMVRALLAGAKTQTRRVLKSQPSHHWEYLPGYRLDMKPQPVEGGLAVRPVHSRQSRSSTADHDRAADLDAWIACPYGAPGDRLWVRERWSTPPNRDNLKPSALDPLTPIRYAADGAVRGVSKRFVDEEGCIAIGKARPGIFMPRWASRITLEVTGVRVERLQAISEEDAMTEGVDLKSEAWPDFPEAMPISLKPRYAFELLWESINGRDSWAINPWVWVVSFRRVE